MIKELILKETVKLAFNVATNFLKKSKSKLESTENDIESSLIQHVQKVKNWSNEISFKDLKEAKNIQGNFIELDLLLYPRRIRLEENENIKTIPLRQIFNFEKNHIAILGQPGAGKTTSMKFLCQAVFFDEKFCSDLYNYPILIKMRDFNDPITSKTNAGIIFEYLFHTLGLKINMEGQKDEEIIATKTNLVLNLIDKLKILIVIDGFDELSYKKHREIVIKEITELANFMENSKLVVTSRTSDFNYSIENVHVYELCSLDENQIELFAEKWLGDKSKAYDFLIAVRQSPFSDTTIRPLTIAHLCAIYERIGKIPEKPKTVYKKVINLLLEEWDEQRSVKRISSYASFEIDRKFEFLSSIAYYLSVKSKKSSFSKETLINAYLQIYENFDLGKKECSNVVQELETHTGLFIQSGFELYEFAHKSLQEYLTAEYIVKLPFLPNEKHLLQSLPNELAIAVSISSNPSNYLTELVQNRFLRNKFSYNFFQTFVTRLLLEKPDFNKNERVGIAALLLYSLYLNPFEAIDSRQLTLFVIDDMVTEFEVLIDEIFKRNTKKFLHELYEKNSVSESINGTKILTLKKIHNSFKYNKIFTMSATDFENLPDYLNCRESFLN